MPNGQRLLLPLCLISVGVVGCSVSLRSASAGQIGCKPSEVTISEESTGFGTRTWTATCHGRDYSCTSMGGAGEGADQVSCSAMDSGGYAQLESAQSTYTSQPRGGSGNSASSAEIKRGYDEERQAHFVTGRFGIEPTLIVTVAGAPKISQGTIVVTLSGYTVSSSLRVCQGVEVLINGEPMATERNAAIAYVDHMKIESRFDFSVFQPLAERFPVFGVRACGTTWAFTPHQLEQLRALLAVYSDLAQKLQNDAQPEPAAPGQTAL